jgi:hypothetical protein
MAKELMEIGGFITEGAEIVNHDNTLSGNGTVDSPLGMNAIWEDVTNTCWSSTVLTGQANAVKLLYNPAIHEAHLYINYTSWQNKSTGNTILGTITNSALRPVVPNVVPTMYQTGKPGNSYAYLEEGGNLGVNSNSTATGNLRLTCSWVTHIGE